MLLCDGCENEAHLACAGLSHVPEGEWFCSSCHARRHDQTKAAHPTKPASQSHDIRRQAGELDEIDGIMIEAFADDDAEFGYAHGYKGTPQLQPQLLQPQSRPRPRKRSRSRSEKASQPQPFRHQLLFSSPRVNDGDSNNSTQAHGSAEASALKDFDFGGLGTAGLGDEKRPKRRKTGPKGKACPLDLSEVPMNLSPIPSDKPGSASRFKGVYEKEKK